MSSESVCQVASNWMDVGSFHTRLFVVVYVTCVDFHDGSRKAYILEICSLMQPETKNSYTPGSKKYSLLAC
jgi:hypothetical protein